MQYWEIGPCGKYQAPEAYGTWSPVEPHYFRCLHVLVHLLIRDHHVHFTAGEIDLTAFIACVSFKATWRVSGRDAFELVSTIQRGVAPLPTAVSLSCRSFLEGRREVQQSNSVTVMTLGDVWISA